MSFRKFHESEGLAAVSRAMKAKKDSSDKEASRQDKAAFSAGEPKSKEQKEKKKDKKKRKLPDGQDGPLDKPVRDKSKVKKEKREKEKKKKKKKKKRRREGTEAEDEGEQVMEELSKPGKKRAKEDGETTETKKKKGKGGAGRGSEGDEVGDDAANQKGCVCRLVELTHESKSLTQASLFAGLGADCPEAELDEALDSAAASAARAVSLLLPTLQRCADMHRQQRRKGSVVGESRTGIRSDHFLTAEEALHTDSGAAGRASLHAQKLWSAVMQCNSEAAVTARTALRGAEATRVPEGKVDWDHEPTKWKTFGDFYRSSFVGAYGDDLEAIRTASSERPVKPELLLKCMQASTSVFSEEDRDLFLFAEKIQSAPPGDSEIGNVHDLLRAIPL